MLATMVLAACSSDDTTEPAVKRGMVLKANVEDTDTRATIDTVGGTWRFAFAMGDEVKVGNNQVEGYYTFKNNGTEFSSADALQTTKDATWYAYFPDETISLVNQSGDLADVANRYALAGATATATTGSDGLTVTMKAKVAVLCIVGVKKGEKLDISVMTDGKYVSGLKAVKNSAEFDVKTSPTKVSLLSKSDAGVYYVVVPAGVKLSVYNGNKALYSGDKTMSTTKADGLKAGKYYTLTTGMTKGSAENSLGETIDWVQLWAGGPKFAVKNVKEEMTWYDAATKKGDEYVWGANWRTPTIDEVFGEGKLNCKTDEKTGLSIPVAGSPSFELKKQGEYLTVVWTGVQPGYTKNTLTLYNQIKQGNHNFDFWTASDTTTSFGDVGIRFGITAYEDDAKEVKIVYIGPYSSDYKDVKYLVRPVLAE